MPRVVIVDDDPLALAVMRRLLTRGGYDVVTCDDACGALREVTQGTTFALIADLHMPDVGGLDLLRSVRDLSPRSFRLLYTGEASLELARAAAEQVAHAIVLKSEGFAVLGETLARLSRASECSSEEREGCPARAQEVERT